MRTFFLLILIALSIPFVCAESAYGQVLKENNISYTTKKAFIIDVFTELSQETGYHFFYDEAVLEKVSTVTVQVKNGSLDTILSELTRQTGLLFKKIDNTISVSRNQMAAPIIQEIQQSKRQITGTVLDPQGDPVIGVNIVEKGTTNGIVTDVNGDFSLSVSDNATLQVSYIGYISQDILIRDKNSFRITLKEDAQLVEEIVVVGYGIQKKSHLTGAIGAVKMDEDISGRPAVEVGQSLYGKIPGVQVIGGSGRPGQSSSVQIRGINSVSANSSPLIVIDGIAIPNYDLNLINNSDVESIEILKDASSSAIYGSRGANGVILITTKKGSIEQPRVSINYLFGIQKLMHKIDVMNSAEYAEAYMDAAQNAWIDKGGDPNAPNTIEARGAYRYIWPEAFNNPESLHDTDWQDEIFDTAPMQKIDVNIAGGSEKTDYMLSVGYVNQQGIMLDSDYEKYSMSLKLNSHINKWLEIGGMLNLNYSHENEAYWRVPEWAVQYPSVFPVYAENGYLGCNSYLPGFENYNSVLFRPNNGHPMYNRNDDQQHRILNNLGNIYASVNILPGLKFKSAFNFFMRRVDDSNYQAMDHNLGEAYYTIANMSVTKSRRLNYTSQNLLTYDKTFGDHELSALAGFEYNSDDFYSTSSYVRDFDNDLLHTLSAGKTIVSASDASRKSTLISYLARVNYSYQNKYMLSAAFRSDGSSKFAPNNKWGFFPSVSAGWMVSEEQFMKSLDWMNMLKFRVSYGLTGNDSFGEYAWIGKLNQAKIAFGNNLETSYYPSGITNFDLKWERTRQFNIGLDVGFLKGRILFNADYYNSVSDGLLLNVPIPAITGFSSVFRNIGKLENKGLELNLTTHNVVNKDFSWNTNFNISGNRNKILELGPDNAPMIFQPESYGGMQKINIVGKSVYNFYGYKYDGVYMNQSEIDNDPASYDRAKPGDGRYVDVNKDGVLNADDRTAIGDPNPKFIWGMTNNFKYKSFDFSFILQGAHDFDIYDDNAHRSLMYHEGRNFLKKVTKRWRSEDNPGDGYHYRLTVDLGPYEKTGSSLWIDKASYLRLKSITFGYTLPQHIAKKIRLESARVYFNGLNLFTITDVDVWDPESFRGNAENASARGVMGNSYPSSKIFSFGVNVEF